MNKKLALVIAGLIGIMSVGVIAANSNEDVISSINEENVLISEIAENEVVSDTDFRVMELQSNGILIGDERGNLNLGSTLKRQEMVVLISRLMGKEEEAKTWNTDNLTFQDVSKDNWAAGYIAWAKDNNITKGYSDEWFGYDDTLTVTQTQIFLLRILGLEAEMDTAEHLAYTNGLMNNVSNSDISEIIRSDVAIMLYNALYIEDDSQQTLANKLGIVSSLTQEEKGLKENMQYYNVEFLKKQDIEENWVYIYIDASNSTLNEKKEDEYKAFIHSIVAVIGYKNIKITDISSNLEIIAYCDAEKLQVLALEVDGIYNYFNMKESF